MKTRRLDTVTRILMVLFVMMLFPMTLFSQGAIDPDYYEYDTQAGKFKKVTLNSYNFLSEASYGTDGIGTEGYILETGRTYVSTGGDNFDKRVFINVVVGTEKVVNIILRDGTSVIASKGIDVPSGVTLNIYAQEAGTGVLEAHGCYDDNSTGLGGTGHFYGAAIGGSMSDNAGSSANTPCGTIIIHGGHIKATGANYSAGIGGTKDQNGGNVTIYGGEVIATGGAGDASYDVAMGIGAGSVSKTAAAGPSQGDLTLNTGVIYYGGTTANPTNKISDGTRFQYMKTVKSYDLWIGSLQVTDANKGDIRAAKPDSIYVDSKVSFNPITSTLSLEDAYLNIGVYSKLSSLTVHLKGANGIYNSSRDCALWSYNTNADLTFECESGATLAMESNAGSANDYSIIQGFNTVNYATGANAAYLKSPHNATWNYDYPALYGFNGKKRMIDGTYSDMDTNLTEATITSDVKYQLWVNFTQVTSDNYGDVLGDNKVLFSPDSHLLILTGASFDGAIMSGLDALTVEFNGSNSLGTSGGYILSSDPNAVLTLQATTSTSTLDLQHSVNRAVLEGFKSVVFYGVGYDTSSGVIYDETNRYMKNGSFPAQSLSLSAAETSYDLWVCGTQVTSANATNILGDGKSKYDSSTNTLTLIGSTGGVGTVTHTSSGTPAVKSGMASLNVVLQNSVWINCTGAYAFEGTVSGATVTISPTSSSSGHLLFYASNDFFKDITPTYQGGLALFASSTVGKSIIRQSPWTGSGTSADPFLIKTTNHLAELATYINTYSYTIDQYFKVDNDIDCSTAGTMESIGNSYNNCFKGTFDGNNKTISKQTTPYGLFGYIGDNCVIKDLTIDNCTVTGSSTDDCVAGLVAQIRTSSAEINNCHVKNSTISSGDNANITSAGGLVGYQWSSTVTGCSVKNTTITLTQQNRSYDQNAGGISAYFYQGTISNCVVEGATISSQNTGNKELHSGAIAGKKGYSLTTLSNNTYDAAVQVRTKKGSEDEIVRSGNTQRGIGYDEVSSYNYDIFTNNGAVLAGVKKMVVSAATNGSVEYVDGYYRVDGNDVYALPYSVSNQLTRIKGTSGVDYDSPAITITPTGAAAISPTSTTTGSDATTGADNATWSIQMPDVDATAAVTFPIDLGNGSRVFTIADFTYNGSGQAVTEIKTKKTSTSTNEITLSLTNGDITFVDYLSSTGETIGPNPPSAAGNYKISIKTGNKTIGSCEVAYKILAATASITAGDQKVTYNGAGQAYSGVTNCPGSYSVTYYPTEADRTNNSNGYTTPLPVNAGDYFVKVTQTDPNYTSSPVDAKFTIEAIEAQFTWGTTQFDYDGNPHAPTASVSNIVDGDACSVTVSGQQTNVGSSYTATISGLGSTNYKLPATAPSTTFSINPIAVGLNWTNTVFTFDGDAHKPTATATGLIGSDVCNVTVTGEQTNASETSYTATATALDNNNYKLPTTGLTQDFTISPCSLAYANIAVIPAETYSGSEIKPTPEVKITLGTSTSETTLSAETDFEYTYANNKNAAKASDNLPPTVTITGKGNYNGTRVVKFTIDQLTATLVWNNTTLTYDGSPQQPTAEVSNLISPDACNVTVTGAQTNAGNYTATATGLDNPNYKLPTTGLTQAFTILDRTANVTFSTGQKYKTFYSAGEDLLLPNGVNGVKAYVVTSVAGNTVNISPISYIRAKVPVLLEASSGATTVKDPNETLPTTNMLKYASADVNTNGTQYVLYSDEFVRATNIIPAGKVYLDLSSSPARTLVIVRNNSATGVDAISNEAADGEDKWYDMQGRQINKPSKTGLYIKNGKKVVVNNK